MKPTKQYVFDFCGTIISKQTHSLLKYFFLKNFNLGYFKKYFLPKDLWLNFDLNYLNSIDNLCPLANYIVENSKATLVYDLIKNHLLNEKILILTVADKRLVIEILSLLGIYNYEIHGSEIYLLMNGNIKGEILKEYQNVVFFTDSLNDFPCFKYANSVVMSEYSESELLVFANCKCNFYTINNYEFR